MSRIELTQADITKQRVDAIVNAANSQLEHGGGLARAIAAAAGPELIEDSQAAPFVPTGEVHATRAGDLPAKHVIHAVGPVWHGGAAGEPELLASAYRRSVETAAELDCETIAFPAISTGIFGYPIELAAPIALIAVREATDASRSLALVRFCLFSNADLAAYRDAAERTGIAVEYVTVS
jgi:O-acetyl-ADP-ribose deacetylase